MVLQQDKGIIMDKERELYDKFVDILSIKLDGDPSPKELEVVMKFLQNQNIQATTKHEGLNGLANKATLLPFDDEDNVLPLRAVK